MTPPPDVGPPRPRVRLRVRVRRLVTAAVLGYLALAGCRVLYAATAESDVPSGDPDLPAGVTVTDETLQCGSGGCWRELTLRWDDELPRAEERALLAPVLGCGATNLFTFRRTCTELQDVEGAPLRLVIQYD